MLPGAPCGPSQTQLASSSLLRSLCLGGTRGHCLGCRSQAYPESLETPAHTTMTGALPLPRLGLLQESALGQIGKRHVLTAGLAEVPSSVLLTTCQVGCWWARGCHLGHASQLSTGGLGVTLIHLSYQPPGWFSSNTDLVASLLIKKPLIPSRTQWPHLSCHHCPVHSCLRVGLLHEGFR